MFMYKKIKHWYALIINIFYLEMRKGKNWYERNFLKQIYLPQTSFAIAIGCVMYTSCISA